MEPVLHRVSRGKQAGNLPQALEVLLAAEKKTRLGLDSTATAKIAEVIVRLCWEARDLPALNAHILILSKRRAQLNNTVGAAVRKCMEFIEEIEEGEPRETLIETLRTVTEGKIYVEVERARLTKMLATAREAEGRIKEASEILQDVQVETFGSMEAKEKADFILEQMRLTLAQRDFVRTQIISNKIKRKVLDGEGFEDIKVRYFKLMIELHTHQREPLKLAHDWEAIYSTSTIQEDDAAWREALQHVALFLALAPFDNEQHDFMLKLQKDRKVEELGAHGELLKVMTTDLIIQWPLPNIAHAGELEAHLAALGGEWAEDLNKRVLQHNIRVVAKAYQRVRMGRLCQLLSFDETDAASVSACEAAVSEMVTSAMIYARIDRPAGIVVFEKPQDPSERLGAWSTDVEECLSLLERTTHLINREFMVAGIPQRA